MDVHELFLSNYLAQTAALAFGKTADEVRAEGTPEEIVPARVFAGNRPTTSILAPALTPAVVGQLIALYEHITFTQGIVWGIDSFDQWGWSSARSSRSRSHPPSRATMLPWPRRTPPPGPSSPATGGCATDGRRGNSFPCNALV